jgi:3',5'-cyclic AMP phosphodiesterase CpdA
MDLTTVADDLVVIHDGPHVHRYEDLTPGTNYRFGAIEVRTLERPAGELLCRLATVNDVHFGEVEAGRVADHREGPIQTSAPGEAPYPEIMNRAAVAEMAAAGIDAVIVKGDLSADGTPEQWAAFEACYRHAFPGRLWVVRGNHDAYQGQDRYAGDQRIEFPGVVVALVDTVVPTASGGRFRTEQADWLDDLAHHADAPVMVMGHHQNWTGPDASGHRSEGYFGINPDDSERLAGVMARRRRIVAYTAGHTHRHRVRWSPMTAGVPSIEVGCVKDFPGTWAEYRVYETGITQVVHRISDAAALAWSERCRHLYADFGVDYEHYALGSLDDRCFNIALR